MTTVKHRRRGTFLFCYKRLVHRGFICGFHYQRLGCVAHQRSRFTHGFTHFMGRHGIVGVVRLVDRTRHSVRRGAGPGFMFFSFSLGVVMLLV